MVDATSACLRVTARGCGSAVCALAFPGIRVSPMSYGGVVPVPEDRRDERRRLIDQEFATVVRTWEEQQRLRRRILGRAHELATRFLSESGATAPFESREERLAEYYSD